MKIAHLADIHIRLLRRHDEYKHVIDNLCGELKKIDNLGAIVVAGDILHSKLELSSELLDLTDYFFRTLSGISEVYVIDGNHDLNLNNTNRMNPLEVIIQKHNHVYLNKNISFTRGNEKFTITSPHITEDVSKIDKSLIDDYAINICIYHGAFNGSRTDVGYEVNSDKYKIDVFDEFDAVLLGDIHKRQCLQSYNKQLKKPEIWYPSSLVQQNYGESLEGHGCLIWDFDKIGANGFVTPIDIHNDYGFVDVNVDGGKIISDTSKIPNKPYIRLNVNNTTDADLELVKLELRKLYDIQELRVINSTIESRDIDQNVIVKNVRDVEYQNDLLVDFISEKYNSKPETIEKIKDINRKVNSEITYDSSNRSVTWKPKKITFSNTFSYGESNEIEFDNMHGVYGLFAPNASGKSGFLDTLLFCLFDKCARTSKAVEVLNTSKNDFNIKFEFELDGRSYFIERSGKRTKTNVKVNVDFYYYDNGEQVLLNGNDRAQTNKVIRNYIGSYDDFILTAFSLQNNNTNYIDMTQSEKKDLLTKFLDIGIFEQINAVGKDLSRDLGSYIKRESKVDYSSNMDEIEGVLFTLQMEISELKETRESVGIDLEKNTNDFYELKSKIKEVDGSDYDLDSLKKKLEENKGRTESLEVAVTKKIKTRDSYNETLKKYKDEYSKYDINTLADIYDNCRNKTSDKTSYKHNIELLNNRKEGIEQSLEHLAEHEYNPDCDICLKNNHITHNSIQKFESELKTVNSELETNSKHLESIMDYLKENKSKIEDYEKSQEISLNINNINSDIHNINYDINVIGNDIEKLKNEKDSLERKIYLVNINQEVIKENEKLKSEMDILDVTIKRLQSEIKSLDSQILNKTTQLGTNQNKLDNIKESLAKLKEAEEEYELYDIYLDSVSRDGIPKNIVSDTLPIIESEVNNILDQIIDFKLQFSMDGKNLDIMICSDDNVRSLTLGSGMEKFISSLAIRMALINITSLPKPNFIAIDEGWGSLDSYNISNVYSLFQYLKLNFGFVLTISHIDSMRDMVDGLVEINKDGDYSKINLCI